MSSDTKVIIGTVIGTNLAVAALLSAQLASVNGRFDDGSADMRDMRSSLRSDMHDLRSEMRSDMHDLRSDLRGEMREMRESMERFDTRLDAVEAALGKVDQRLLTIKRVVLPAAPPNE